MYNLLIGTIKTKFNATKGQKQKELKCGRKTKKSKKPRKTKKPIKYRKKQTRRMQSFDF
jgi:hypothetical protein